MGGGCYSTAFVARGDVQQLRPGTGDARLLPGSGASHPALLDSEAMVRGLGPGGDASSGWFRARDLRVMPQGLMAGPGFPVGKTAHVLVTGLDTEAAKRLLDLAPPDGKLERPLRFGGAYELKTRGGPDALRWALRFVTDERVVGGRAGTWHLERRTSVADLVLGTGNEPEVAVSADQLAEAARSPDAILGPGISWAASERVEVRYFDPFLSAMTVPLFPFALLLAALDRSQMDYSLDSPAAAQTNPAAILLWSPPASAEDERLFDGSARRRAIIKAFAAMDLGASVRGDLISGLAAGIRLRNSFEFTVVARELSWNLSSDHGGRITRPAAGAAVGIHVDSDADPRFAIAFGGEVVGAGGPNALRDITLKWGARLGLGRYLFVTLSPLNITSLKSFGPGPSGGNETTTVLSSVELGGAL